MEQNIGELQKQLFKKIESVGTEIASKLEAAADAKMGISELQSSHREEDREWRVLVMARLEEQGKLLQEMMSRGHTSTKTEDIPSPRTTRLSSLKRSRARQSEEQQHTETFEQKERNCKVLNQFKNATPSSAFDGQGSQTSESTSDDLFAIEAPMISPFAAARRTHAGRSKRTVIAERPEKNAGEARGEEGVREEGVRKPASTSFGHRVLSRPVTRDFADNVRTMQQQIECHNEKRRRLKLARAR